MFESPDLYFTKSRQNSCKKAIQLLETMILEETFPKSLGVDNTVQLAVLWMEHQWMELAAYM